MCLDDRIESDEELRSSDDGQGSIVLNSCTHHILSVTLHPHISFAIDNETEKPVTDLRLALDYTSTRIPRGAEDILV